MAVEVLGVIGEQVDQPYAVHLERPNGSLRDHFACLIRKTLAFAKDVPTRGALFSLILVEHNGIRPHLALRRPLPRPTGPLRYERQRLAMALGLPDHPWG